MMISLFLGVYTVQHDLSERVRTRRLVRGWTQAQLAERSGVALATLRKFERTGEISLARLLRIAAVLDELPAFGKLFEPPPALTLDALEARDALPTRKYGKRTRVRSDGAT